MEPQGKVVVVIIAQNLVIWIFISAAKDFIVGNVVTSSSGSKAEVGMYKFHFDFGRYSLRSYPSLGIEA